MHLVFVVEALAAVHTDERIRFRVDQFVDFQFVKRRESLMANITG